LQSWLSLTGWGLLEMSFKYTRTWRKNHIRNSFLKTVEKILRSLKLIGVIFVWPFNLIFFGNQFFRSDMKNESSKIFIVLINNLMIKHCNLSILKWCCVFFSYVTYLTCLVWICVVTIIKKSIQLSKCWLFVQFRANSKRL